MAQSPVFDREIGRGTLYWLVGGGISVLALEVAAVLAYVRASGSAGLSVGRLGYPLVWINLTLVVVAVARRRSSPLAGLPAVLASGYFLVLAWLGGLVSIGGTGRGLSVHSLPPGWGPVLIYDHAVASVSLVPFRVIGYLGLAYLVAVTLGSSLRAGSVGLVGLFSFVSCSGSVLAVLVASVAGGSVATVEAIGWSQELSMLAFVASLVALVWVIERPTAPDSVPDG
jgi:hypothetical protein